MFTQNAHTHCCHCIKIKSISFASDSLKAAPRMLSESPNHLLNARELILLKPCQFSPLFIPPSYSPSSSFFPSPPPCLSPLPLPHPLEAPGMWKEVSWTSGQLTPNLRSPQNLFTPSFTVQMQYFTQMSIQVPRHTHRILATGVILTSVMVYSKIAKFKTNKFVRSCKVTRRTCQVGWARCQMLPESPRRTSTARFP